MGIGLSKQQCMCAECRFSRPVPPLSGCQGRRARKRCRPGERLLSERLDWDVVEWQRGELLALRKLKMNTEQLRVNSLGFEHRIVQSKHRTLTTALPLPPNHSDYYKYVEKQYSEVPQTQEAPDQTVCALGQMEMDRLGGGGTCLDKYIHGLDEGSNGDLQKKVCPGQCLDSSSPMLDRWKKLWAGHTKAQVRQNRLRK
ncbi:uncharacterized [Tachysurus ichikawai]